MADREIVQDLIAALGQSQGDRDAPALDPASAPLHALDAARLLMQAQRIAERIRFDGGPDAAANLNWRGFYPTLDEAAARQLLAREDGRVTPHLALAAAFARLFDAHPRRLANGFTARHLDVQLRDVLGFVPRAALPDRAHVVVELKKGVAGPLALRPGDVLLAGKDASGVERHYRPVRETFVGAARVVSLRAQHRDAQGRVSAAPVADSADGLGAPLASLAPALPSWPAFGPRAGRAWPDADIGFAVASPLLALAEGERTVELLVALEDALPAALLPRLASLFEAVYATPEGWSVPWPATAAQQGAGAFVLGVVLPPDAPPCVAIDAALHGSAFATRAPVVQWRLREGASLAGLDGLTVASLSLAVRVRGLAQSLVLENDAGALNPKRAFQPFGAQPVVGSRFMVGCAEALAKPLTNLALHLAWQAAPSDLHGWYDGYSRRGRLSNGVTATLSYTDGRGRRSARALDLMARDAAGVSVLRPDAPPPGREHWAWGDELLVQVVERLASKGARGHAQLLKRRYGGGGASSRDVRGAPQAQRPGFVTLQLDEDFLHADHRRETVANALAGVKTVLNEPYTPMVQSIHLDYDAQSEPVPLAPAADEAGDAARYAEAELQWFHVGPFGARREHAFLRRQQPFLASAWVPLVPEQRHEGELLIGLANVGAGDALSLLVQVAEGTADPALAPPALAWSVLAGDQWRPLDEEQIALDSTHGLLQSGLVSIAVPREATTAHSWLPGGLTWLRVSAAANTRATCELLAVAANAVELAFDDRGNDPQHAAAPLPAGSIAKLQRPRAEIKAIVQPFDSFGGRLAESDAAMRRRAAERLRHRGRALAPWDIERLVLEAFPQLHQVKCIPHARPGQWLAPGHTTVVVVPQLRSAAAGTDPLAPRVDLGTLEAIRAFLLARGPMGTGLVVKNAQFEALRADFGVRLRPGVAFNPQRDRLNELLEAALTPWAFDGATPIRFGGRVFRSVLLALVESQPSVDFVTDFRLRRLADDGTPGADAAEHGATRPDAILVSAPRHGIVEVI